MTPEMREYLMSVAILAANMSKVEGSTKVGAVITSNEGHLLSAGWNGYAPGVNDEYINTLSREDRLRYTIHAEENALLNAAKFGTSLDGAVIFVTRYPCSNCISKMVKSGITIIYYCPDEDFERRWRSKDVDSMFHDVVQIIPQIYGKLLKT